MLAHDFPGNVRELENLIQRAVVTAQGELLMPQHIIFSHAAAAGSTAGPVDIEAALRRGQSLPSLLGSVERRAVLFAIQECNGDRDAAARFLRIERDELDEKLRRYEAGDSSDADAATAAAAATPPSRGIAPPASPVARFLRFRSPGMRP